jgi:hypothetical protein
VNVLTQSQDCTQGHSLAGVDEEQNLSPFYPDTGLFWVLKQVWNSLQALNYDTGLELWHTTELGPWKGIAVFDSWNQSVPIGLSWQVWKKKPLPDH